MAKLNFLQLWKLCYLTPSKLGGRWGKKKFQLLFLLRSIMSPIQTTKYLYVISEFDFLSQLIPVNNILPSKIHRPYLHKNFNLKRRAKCIIEHYSFVNHLSFENPLRTPYKNFLLFEKNMANDVKLDVTLTPCPFDREGELALNVIFNETVFARISFSFILYEKEMVIFIGGVQGPKKGVDKNCIKHVTKLCHGLFPKRVAYEYIMKIANICHINKILAVNEDCHVYRQIRYRNKKEKSFLASYSSFWNSINGLKNECGLYELPVNVNRKNIELIPSKKRSEYKKRFILLDEFTSNLNFIEMK
ncbi:TPA: DUF535 domain-containing protein [Escherichia coli]|nr:DUF535 domain-containing protein [Escherichia coli]HBN2051222.1 DUF535 domain-containing protein [Escherichia coli]HCQ3777348.1 DUF535 domain-containing protein [Escherichia coli]HCQ3813773.1 DUF535 domain-containing protein [Escherichia coli]HCQ3827154.1 DUF535 domain-containing protein [Escherichia coli]